MTLRLPYPNSTNTHWRNYLGRVVLSAAGRRYRDDVLAAVLSEGPPPRLTGRLKIVVEATPPDARKRDVDNLFKSLLDSLQHAAVIQDDRQIECLVIRRLPPQPGGAVNVTITTIDKR